MASSMQFWGFSILSNDVIFRLSDGIQTTATKRIRSRRKKKERIMRTRKDRKGQDWKNRKYRTAKQAQKKRKMKDSIRIG